MTRYTVTLSSRRHAFDGLRELLACASPKRSGDVLAGIAAESEAERVAAQMCLAEVPLQVFLDEPLVDADVDEVTRLILDQHRADAFAPVRSMSVGELRDWMLAYDTTTADLTAVAWGLTPEMVAAVSKIMGNHLLIINPGIHPHNKVDGMDPLVILGLKGVTVFHRLRHHSR